MGNLTICLELSAAVMYAGGKTSLEEQYQRGFKRILTFLYTHPRFPLAIPFTGELLVFFEESHPEALEILKELTNRHQVEVLGGGYYAPVFPLLFPVDRSGQIEKLNAELRATVGKRPRGMTLFGSIWDSSLVTTFQSCDMEYVHIDSALVPPSARGFYPLITGEQGKSVKLLPLHDELCPLAGEAGKVWVDRLKRAVYGEGGDGGSTPFSPVLTIPLNPFAYDDFFQSPICEYISRLPESGESSVTFSLPQAYFRGARKFIPAYIPAGMGRSLARWGRTAYSACEDRSGFPVTIHDYLNTYGQARHLYERMMYISMRVGQSGGDKVRKKAAQEKLWEAQGGLHYINAEDGLPASAEQRQAAYRALNEAEKLIREGNDFKESFTRFDYNGDGLNEYVCRMQTFHAVIAGHTGQIVGLDMINGGPDYAANTDPARTIFVEHLYEEGRQAEMAPLFFTERKFDARRQEIQLEGQGSFGAQGLPVSLRKNYIVTTNGFVVQYILKNEGDAPLRGVFGVEANFAQTVFDGEGQYEAELVVNGGKETLPSALPYGLDKGVSMLQIVDRAGKLSFRFEPNEEAGFRAENIPFDDGSHAFSVSFAWMVGLEAKRSMEKTINFAIVPVRNS